MQIATASSCNDCDDTDAALGDISLDADCDGTLFNDDCDDNDANSTVIANDADCDGVSTAMDCDDNDSSIGSSATMQTVTVCPLP